MNASQQELIEYASKKVKAVGFVLFYTSMKSEACYYTLNGFDGLLRIAAHRFGRTQAKSMLKNSPPVFSCITFPKEYKPKTWEAVDRDIALAVGNFIMRRVSRNLLDKQSIRRAA